MRRLLATLTLPVLLFAAACGSDSVTNPTGSAAGAYTLYSINGSRPPYTFPSSMTTGYTVTINSGTLRLNSDFSYSENTNYTITPNGGTPTTSDDPYNGTWTQNGTGITTTDTQGGKASYTWDGRDQLTFVEQGITIIYRK